MFSKPLNMLRPAKPAPATTGDIVRVDRTQEVIYPDWVDNVLYPELERTGPAEFALSSVELWLHEEQKDRGFVCGRVIHEYLVGNDMIAGCLGLADGLAIQKKGINVFRKYFGGKVVYLYKSVVQDRYGNLIVPYVIESGDEVVVHWCWLAHRWYGSEPAARFAS